MEEGKTEELKNQTSKEIPQPLAIIFLEKVEQEWERKQANLDGLVEEAIRNENSLFNLISLSEAQNIKTQLRNNISRWIQLPNEELLLTNGLLVLDILESNVKGEFRNGLGDVGLGKQQTWKFKLEVFPDNPLEVSPIWTQPITNVFNVQQEEFQTFPLDLL